MEDVCIGFCKSVQCMELSVRFRLYGGVTLQSTVGWQFGVILSSIFTFFGQKDVVVFMLFDIII